MGGNALKKVETRRYTRQEYFKAWDRLIGLLTMEFPDNKFYLIRAYADKQTFGDMDVLHNIKTNNLAQRFKHLLDASEMYVNGSVISLNLDDFQIDMIYSCDEEFDYASNYFDFNDLGNLRGRICHKFGLKHGHNGLFLPIREDTNMIHELLLTHDHNKTLEFIGLQSRDDFKSLEDIFEHVASSPYFNSDIYLFDNLNAVSRIRDKKRETYNKFLEWNRNNPRTNYTFDKDKSVYLDKILDFFGVREQYDSIMLDHQKKKAAKEKFNGTIVSDVTGLENKELGLFMVYIKNNCDVSIDKVLEMSDNQIHSMIWSTYAKYVDPTV